MTADANEWWAGIGGQALGPLSAAEVRARWEAGEITASTLVWRAGFAEWRPAGDVAEVVALRSTAAPSAAWKPGAGSALAALAGAELQGLQRGGALPAIQAPRNGAVPPLDPQVTSSPAPRDPPVEDRATASDRTAHAQAPFDAATGASIRRGALVTGVATFALGAAFAVGLVVFFRGGDREQRASRAAPAEVSAAQAAAPAPAPDRAQGAPTATASAPAEKTPAPATPGTQASSDARPAIARNNVEDSAPVRASIPPADANGTPRSDAAARAHHVTKAPSHPKPVRARVAQAPSRRSTPKAAAPVHAPKASSPSEPLASAAPASPDAAPRKSASRDPLADLVTDSDLDRELGGGPSSKEAATAPSATAPRKVAEAPARKPADSVFVPPAPGSDLPDGVSAAQINEAVKARMASLRSCIDEQRSSEPASKGTLKLRWVIAGDGSVKDVRNLSPEYEGKPIARCIGGVVREIRFPTSRTSGQEVVFPFRF